MSLKITEDFSNKASDRFGGYLSRIPTVSNRPRLLQKNVHAIYVSFVLSERRPESYNAHQLLELFTPQPMYIQQTWNQMFSVHNDEDTFHVDQVLSAIPPQQAREDSHANVGSKRSRDQLEVRGTLGVKSPLTVQTHTYSVNVPRRRPSIEGSSQTKQKETLFPQKRPPSPFTKSPWMSFD